MEFLLELIFSIVFDGCIELASERKVPLPVRIICALLVIAVYLLLGGGLVLIGIFEKQPVISIIGVFILLLMLILCIKKYRERMLP